MDHHGGITMTKLHPAIRWEYRGQTYFETYADCVRQDATGPYVTCLLCLEKKKLQKGDFQAFGFHLWSVHRYALAYGHEAKFMKCKVVDGERDEDVEDSRAAKKPAGGAAASSGTLLAAWGGGESFSFNCSWR